LKDKFGKSTAIKNIEAIIFENQRLTKTSMREILKSKTIKNH
jgi:hypothetical protein